MNDQQRKCTNCIHLSEDLAGGTGKAFCSCGDIGWDSDDEFNPETSAQHCDFFSSECKCENCGKHILGKLYTLPLSTICPECRNNLADILIYFDSRTTQMSDRDHQVIGHSFSKLLLDEDIERIITLLRQAEITSGGGVASRLYLTTRLRFETVATLLKTSRGRYDDSQKITDKNDIHDG